MMLFVIALRLLPEIRNRADLTDGEGLESLVALLLKHCGTGDVLLRAAQRVLEDDGILAARPGRTGPDTARLSGLVGVVSAPMALFGERLIDKKGSFVIAFSGIGCFVVLYVTVMTVCWHVVTVVSGESGLQFWNTALQTNGQK
jgi:hypothetical protein